MTAAAYEIDWTGRAHELAATLARDGMVTDPAWLAAFERVPRHVFVPRFWALDEHNAPARLIDGADPGQREEWLGAVYRDQFLATRWAMQDGYRMISSSASLPRLVAHMLELLDPVDGHRVLEIGTGTGYNTALLCHRVGDGRVTSIDIDAVLVAEAASRLAQLGYLPQVVAGDGTDGIAYGAPYDRILSTCASPGVPTAWIDQLADGGKLVAPFTVGGALAALTKTGPDQVSGYLDSEKAWFMPLRSDIGRPAPDGLLIAQPPRGRSAGQHYGTSDIDPAAFADPDFRLWLSMQLPVTARVVDQVEQVGDEFSLTGVLVHTAEHRAEAIFPTGTAQATTVTQDARRLFDTVETAWRTWQRYGRPERARIGITARTDGTQRLWLDTADSEINWPLP